MPRGRLANRMLDYVLVPDEDAVAVFDLLEANQKEFQYIKLLPSIQASTLLARLRS